MAESGDNGRESARPLVSVLVALFTGAGIAFQQLSTGQPQSLARWAMLAGGSIMGGLGGLLAAGLFDTLLTWSGGALAKLRRLLQPRVLSLVGGLCVLALALGYLLPKGVDWAERWWRGCPQAAAVRVLTSVEQLGAARLLADAYESATAQGHHGCPTAELYVYAARPADARAAVGSGWTNDALRKIGPRPDVWLPDDSADVAAAREAAGRFAVPVPIEDARSVAASPVVLGVPAIAVPDDLIDRRDSLTWQQLWDTVKANDWDVLRPDPAVSAAGTLATTALYARVRTDAAAARVVEQRIERSLDAGGFPLGDSTELLCHKRGEDPRRAVVLATEQALVRYNQGLGCGLEQGPPDSEATLVVFYPTDTIAADHPFVRLAWNTGRGTADAARDFGAWLRSDDGQRALVRAALRPPPLTGVAEPLTERFGAHAGVAFDRRPPSPEVTGQVLQRYAQARRPGRILLALDVSGSMQSTVDRSGATRLKVATAGVTRALELMSGRDEFGLRVFPADGRGPAWRDLVPLGRADVPVDAVPRARAATDRLGGVRPAGGTPLLPTVLDGVRDAGQGGPEDRIASLVVLTDGNDTTGRSPSEVDIAVRDRGVRVFFIAIGEASCGAFGLRDIAAHTGGACYDAAPASIGDVLTDLFALLWGGQAGA